MNDPAQPSEASEDANALSKHTTPTWEIELLISGATVFALMQLPALLDRTEGKLLSQFGADTATLLISAHMYLTSAVLVLIATFILHLALRAHWVAVVGLYSVFPDGVRFDSLSHWGRISRGLVHERTRSIPEAIERADNRSSLVFGAGIGIALLLLLLLGVLMIPVLLAALVCVIAGHWNWLTPMALGATVALIVPFLMLILIDRRFGSTLPATGSAHRWLATGLRGYQRIGLGTGFNLPLLIFQTHLGNGRRADVRLLCLLAIVLAMQQGKLRMEQPNLLPRESASASAQIFNDHYATRRDDSAADAPFIDDLFESGSYLTLFVPYRETHAFGTLRTNCPDADVTAARNRSTTPSKLLLACYARLHGISIDGVAVNAAFDVARDPKSGQRGLLAVLPIRQLGPGRHELVIGGSFDDDNRQAAPDRIPFWR